MSRAAITVLSHQRKASCILRQATAVIIAPTYTR
jgi:hypothetical protein